MNNNKQETSTDLAGRQFEFDDYKKKDALSSGLAETHEQMSDGYYVGTVEQKNQKK